MTIEKPEASAQQAATEGIEHAYKADQAFARGDKETFKKLVRAAETNIGLNQPGAQELKPESKTIERLKQKTDQIRQAMFKKYEGYGVKLEQFKAIQFGNRLVVTYVSGIDLHQPKKGERLEQHDPRLLVRSWNSIQDSENDSRFMVKIGEETYDTRKGMTKELHQELVKQGLAAMDENGQLKHQIWLTGEEAIDSSHAIVTGKDLIDGAVTISGAYRGSTKDRFLFRPAVVITDNLTAYLAENFSE